MPKQVLLNYCHQYTKIDVDEKVFNQVINIKNQKDDREVFLDLEICGNTMTIRTSINDLHIIN